MSKHESGDGRKMKLRRSDLKPPWNKKLSTPLIQVGDNLFAKLETVNPTGSIKDRLIQYIVTDALEQGDISDRSILVEATSGNTGISLAAIGASLNVPVKIIMPENMSEERKKMMRIFGAEIVEVPPSDFSAAIDLRNEMIQDSNHWSPMQFSNHLNIECHQKTTAKEIAYDVLELQAPGVVPRLSALVTGSGTGGTIMGCKNHLIQLRSDMETVLVKPAEEAKDHGIQGINDGADFLCDISRVDKIINVSTRDAIDRSRQLAREQGLLVGISSGANLLAAERWIEENNPTGAVVTFLCDRGERYLSVE